MVSIVKQYGKTGSTYRVQFRKTGRKSINATFKDKDTAELWGRYKEQLHEEMIAFNVPKGDIYTLREVFILKFGEGSREYKECLIYFTDWWDTHISKISYDDMKKHCQELLRTKVSRGGGSGHTNGRIKYPTPTTILRKFAYD